MNLTKGDLLVTPKEIALQMIQTRPIWSGQAWESFSNGAKVSHFFLSNHPVKKQPLWTLGGHVCTAFHARPGE